MEHILKTILVIFERILVIIFILELIIGNLGNGVLALVNFIDWVKRKNISLVNQILTALSTSRIFLLWSLLTGLFITLRYPDLIQTVRMIKFLNNLWIISNHFSIWLATCLSIFYFLKISNFSNFIFLYLKWRVRKAVSVTLLVSLVLLFLNILLVNLEINVCINEYERNTSYSFGTYYHANCHRHVLILHMIFLTVPFAVTLPIFLLLIFSLWTHCKKMQQHVQACRDAGTTAHFKALQTMIAFLLLYTIFILSMSLQFLKYELLKQNLFILFCQVVYIAFPSFHSCILILADVKRRQVPLCVVVEKMQD
ncbi:LOW QUALITY PROTEIN: taste receptor type 2 member 117-like [Psammomys obesus]|uniref:LOW QUALITY PROTEIN: taste receptor type 2 member 117-like n=1 Tax=Psammomys obesus TaxID=48139 RepID=UPI00245319A2|nr:LOW QUALITY PROTEIN: taste receptor type 2 member 117-like [Psammomys obesus]